MLHLIDLKARVLNAIRDLSKESFDESFLKKIKANEYISIDLPLANLDLIELTQFAKASPRMFFKQRGFDQGSRKEVLGLGSNITFTKKSDYNKILDITEKCSKIHIIGAQRFDTNSSRDTEWGDLGECFFFVPKVCLIKKGESTLARIQFPKKILSNPREKAKYSFALNHCLEFETHEDIIERKSPSTLEVLETPGKQTWDHMISTSLDFFTRDNLDKVVLARKKIVICNDQVNSLTLLKELHEKASESYLGFIQIDDQRSFLTLTPERLFLKEHHSLKIDSIAGTRKRSHNEAEDKLLENDLKSSPKEIKEHRLVTNTIKMKMQNLGLRPEVKQIEEVLKLHYVQHIHSKIEAYTTKKDNFAVLINTFHPTPAVGGLPGQKALGLINELEPFDRGLYAAPIGYISGDSTEFAVAIRSALFENDRIHIYGGAGIVTGSNSEQEWEETGMKMNHFITYLQS